MLKIGKFFGIADYLAGEAYSDLRHEYAAGEIYAMVGGTSAHNAITLNLASALRSHLSGSGCRTFMSDMKVRVQDQFYYPDVLVTREPWDKNALYQTQPVLIIEVLSESTEQKDRFHKRAAYQTLDSLKEYMIVALEGNSCLAPLFAPARTPNCVF